MSRRILLSALVLLVFVVSGNASEPIAIMSINVRCSTADDGKDSWPHRKEMLLNVVKQGNYDFIGGQEVVIHPDDNRNQLKYLTENLVDYGVLACCREKDPTKGESMPVFYRKDRWRPDKDFQGTFWLSDTPEVVGSNTWKGQSGCPRIATGALFHEIKDDKETGVKLFVYSTHFDHIGETARQKSAELILTRLLPKDGPQVPVVLMGDFNCGEGSPAIRYIKGDTVKLDGEVKKPPMALVDSFRLVHPEEKNVATFHGFKGTDYTYNNVNKVGAKIDYIFVTPGVKCLEAEIIRTNDNGRYPTDHYPIRATIQL